MRMHSGAYDDSDVLAIGGVAVAGDAFDAAIMRKHVGRHFGTEVTYRVPFGSNVMRMPPALIEKICSPADASLLSAESEMTFLRNLNQWSLGPEDQRILDQLLTFIEDRLGFRVFEAIEQTKRKLSDRDQAEFHFRYPTVEVDELIQRTGFELSSARATEAIARELDATLERAGVTPSEVDIVCCTGGTARIPSVERALSERFGAHKMTQFQNFHSVILGLSEHARARLAA
jgi:hypothetical chaperone protein